MKITYRQVREYLVNLASFFEDCAKEDERFVRKAELCYWSQKIFDFLDFFDKLEEMGDIEDFESNGGH